MKKFLLRHLEPIVLILSVLIIVLIAALLVKGSLMMVLFGIFLPVSMFSGLVMYTVLYFNTKICKFIRKILK